MKKVAALLSLLFALLLSQAQTVLQEYSWDPKPHVDSLTQGVENVDALILLNKRVAEFTYDNENNLTEDFLVHCQIYVNSETAIDDHNKVYLNISSSTELKKYNARVMTADGKIKSLGQDALKKGTTEEGETYNYFAIAGAEKGAVIEYYYIMKRRPLVNGAFMSLKNNLPIKTAEFIISSPPNLVFSSKSLNGYAPMETDTSYTEQNVLVGRTVNIPKLPSESFANNGANSMGVIYQLDKNKYTGASNIFNYGDLSQNIFSLMNPEISRSNKKDLENILKKAQVKIALDERDRIFKVENYLKTNFQIVEQGNPELSELDFMLENFACNEAGATILLYQLYKMAEINMEVVLTCNRYEMKFDPEYDSYIYLDTYLLYFPSIDDYLIPSGVIYRLGLIPPGFINNHGLFIKTITIGDMTSGVGEVKFISSYPAEHSINNLLISVAFNENMDKLEVDLEEKLSGYYAFNYQPYFTYIDSEEDKIKLKESIAKSINENIDIEEISMRNEGVDMLMREPFEVSCKFSSSNFIENAGSKVLFKLGQLIGPQAELYQDEKRRNPVENDFNRKYYREINFTIPEGYSCKNLEDLNLVVQPFKDDHDGAGFVSTYQVSGNKIKVLVDEYYPQLEFPIEEYPQYREVINAAADFNKIVLVLEES